jgi:hypothetical protein
MPSATSLCERVHPVDPLHISDLWYRHQFAESPADPLFSCPLHDCRCSGNGYLDIASLFVCRIYRIRNHGVLFRTKWYASQIWQIQLCNLRPALHIHLALYTWLSSKIAVVVVTSLIYHMEGQSRLRAMFVTLVFFSYGSAVLSWYALERPFLSLRRLFPYDMDRPSRASKAMGAYR